PHTKGSGAKLPCHILRGATDKSNLKIVNDTGAVRCDSGNNAALHQIDNQRGETHLYGMGSHAQDHRPAVSVSLYHCPHYGFYVACCKKIRQAVCKSFKRAALKVREGCLIYGYFAVTVFNGISF